MILLDFLTIADENKRYFVRHKGKIVAVYDGKNSIDTKWNNYEIKKIEWFPGKQILIVLK